MVYFRVFCIVQFSETDSLRSWAPFQSSCRLVSNGNEKCYGKKCLWPILKHYRAKIRESYEKFRMAGKNRSRNFPNRICKHSNIKLWVFQGTIQSWETRQNLRIACAPVEVLTGNLHDTSLPLLYPVESMQLWQEENTSVYCDLWFQFLL